jgi:hypothetical protein
MAGWFNHAFGGLFADFSLDCAVNCCLLAQKVLSRPFFPLKTENCLIKNNLKIKGKLIVG